MTKTKDLLFIVALISIIAWSVFTFIANGMFTSTAIANTNTTIAPTTQNKTTNPPKINWLSRETKVITAQTTNFNPEAVKVALTAYQKARAKGLDDKEILTIIDYSKPSADRRLLVVDMKNQKVLMNTWVAHGKNSGEAKATSFSNAPSSLKSSLGVFVTSDVFDGKHGKALRVQGLEKGVNDNAYRRDIEFHSAQYVGPDVAKSRGMVGRSWGCMAVDPNTIKPLINTIKGKTIVVAYYPNEHWMNNSPFLT